MAKPTSPIVVWARQDVKLPGTGKLNKSKPIDDLLDKGYDKGQKPAAEEFNYILNQSSGWIDWIVNEKFPELEAEITRLLQELEARINQQISALRQDINGLKQDVADLKRYVDQSVADLKQEIQGVRRDVSQLRQDFDQAIAQVNGRIDELEPRLVPIGAVIPWPGQTPPNGWLECNGQIFNTGSNPKLYGVLGRNTVPDYRGLFLRGWAHGSPAYDEQPNRGLGSIQDDSLKAHEHYLQMVYQNSSIPAGASIISGPHPAGTVGYELRDAEKSDNYIVRLPLSTSKAMSEGGAETRPKNAAVMYIIKTDQAQSSGGQSPTAIVVSPDTVSGRVGYSVQATASVLPSSIAGQYPVTWSSQNPAVATVSSSGMITLVGAGTTNIIASISTGMNAVIQVTSYSVLTSLLVADPGSIQVDQSKMLTVNKTPGNATEPLEYQTSNASVAVVNNAGYVTGISPGTATITVRGTLSGVSTTRLVTIIPAEVEQTLEDIQLGVAQTTTNTTIPAGCVLVMVTGPVGSTDPDFTYRYKPIQKKIGGVWVTISG